MLLVKSTIQTNILCCDARPPRFDQTSRHNGAIDELFIRGNSNGTQDTAYTMIYNIHCRLSAPHFYSQTNANIAEIHTTQRVRKK